MIRNEKLHFETAAKLGRLIGRELITNNTIAIFELIKNSYDAFSPIVDIYFDGFKTKGDDKTLREMRNVVISSRESKVVISDKGIGMTYEEIKKYWMNIGTSSKEGQTVETRKIRENLLPITRFINGEKGIGRFGSDKLGAKLTLTSIGDEGREKSVLDIDWDKFNQNDKKVQDIDFDCKVEISEDASQETGVTLKIESLRDIWTGDDIIKLKRQLKKMISPFTQEKDNFSIYIHFGEYTERIVNDSFDYANTTVDAGIDPEGKITYTITDSFETITKQINSNPPIYGPVSLKILYMDKAAKINFARRSGISVHEYGNIKLFRDSFRILPYGEAENDWLGIDNKHAQAVFRTLGTRDIIGYVQITKKSNPKLRDATNRQGLNEDTPEFSQFRSFIWESISVLQEYIFDRIKTESEKQGKIIHSTVIDIKSNIDSWKSELPKVFKEVGLSEDQIQQINNQTLTTFKSIEKSVDQVEKANTQLSSRLRVMEKIVGAESMLYDILHAIKNKLAGLEAIVLLLEHNAKKYNLAFNTSGSTKMINDIKTMVMAALKRTSPTRNKQTVIIMSEFLDSYIEEKRLVYPDLVIAKAWNDRFQRVKCNVDGFKIVLDNLIDNSIKALHNKNNKKILIQTFKRDRYVEVIFEDNGEGILEEHAPFIFNTSFSRTGGTGIGLATSLHFMQEQQGDISLLSESGVLGGATFSLKIPILGG